MKAVNIHSLLRFPFLRRGSAPAPGEPAPLFSASAGEDGGFSLTERKGKWTVLYFYPKDDTPGCTKQACAFRDSIAAIRAEGAEVFGISRDGSASHGKFVKKYGLNFPLLSDEDGSISEAYGVKGVLGFSKRWTFILDPELTIRSVQKNVNPASNAAETAATIKKLKQQSR